MRTSIEKRARIMRKKHLWNTRWKKVLSVMVSVTVFGVTYMLILPAITESTGVYCGYEEHVHTDECYGNETHLDSVVDVETPEILADEGHFHTDECYETVSYLVCGQDERDMQTAVEVVETVPASIETDEEGNEIFIPAVTEEVEVLTDEGHIHTDECYVTDICLVCGQEEYDPVYETTTMDVTHSDEHDSLIIDEDSFVFDGDDLYTDDWYIDSASDMADCGKQEHIHTELCYSNRAADVETAVEWEMSLPDREAMTGVLSRDVVLVAESQLGYRESTDNFDLVEGMRQGYTRYGAMQGVPYAKWSAAFVQFCLHYAGIRTGEIDGDPDVYTFAWNLSDQDNYCLLDPFNLMEGDLVYLDTDGDTLPDQMGIVSGRETRSVNDQDSTDAQVEKTVRFTLIEGDSRDLVEKNRYDIDDDRIVAVSRLPREEAETILAEEPAWEETAPEEGTGEAYAAEPVTEENAEEEDDAQEAVTEESAEESITEENTEESIFEEETEEETETETGYELPAVVELASVTETGVRINFSAPAEAFPEGVRDPYLVVEEITSAHADFEGYEAEAKNHVEDDFHVYRGARFFDITIMDGEGETVTLRDESSARVEIIYSEELAAVPAAEETENSPAEPVMPADAQKAVEEAVDLEESDLAVLHFAKSGTELLSGTVEMDSEEQPAIRFETPGFSVFGVVETETLTSHVITAQGEDFIISVTYGPEAQIPSGAALSAEEIPADSQAFTDMLAQAEETVLGGEPGHRALREARFFKLAIVNTEGETVEPAVPVEVSFAYESPITVAAGEELYMVSFRDDVLNTLENVLSPVTETDGETVETDKNAEQQAVFAADTVVVGVTGAAVTADDEITPEDSGSVPAEEPQTETVTLESVSFEQESLSVAGTFVNRELTASFLSADGHTYKVTVSYYDDAQIPEGAVLSLTEYEEDSEEYSQIKELHQPIEITPVIDEEDLAMRIDQEVADVMESQENAMRILMSNGDMDETEFVLKSEAEIRAEVEAIYADQILDKEEKAATDEDTLALIDITIYDREGNEVEPEAPVQVEIVMETIPDEATGLDLKNTLQVEHYTEGEDGLESEIVVNPDASVGEIWVTEEDVVRATFTTDSFSFYTLAWNQSDQHLQLDVMRLSVYYGFLVNDTFREFGPMSWVRAQYAEENTTGDGNLVNGNHVYELNKTEWVTGMSAYKDYTFARAVVHRDGYNDNGRDDSLSHAQLDEIAWDSTYGGPVITGNETDGYTVQLKKGGSYRLGNADQIYVIFDSPYGEGMDYNYAKTSTPDNPVYGGDTYGLNEEGIEEPLGEPEHTKTLSENQSNGRNDNTYRLSLTATGKVNQTKNNTKADIILVTDYSGSMQSGGKAKLEAAVNGGLLPPLRELEERFGYGTIEISHIAFSTVAQIQCRNVPLTDYTFTAWASGATNYEDALNKLGQIRTRSDAKQYVIFITDGNPTVRNSKGTITDWSYESDIYAHAYYKDEYAWSYHKNKWQWVKVEDIHADGNWYYNIGLYGKGVEAAGHVRDCYNVTIPYVQQLVKNKVDFSVIATRSGATYASNMVAVGNAAAAGSSHYYYAEETDDIKAAFADILASLEQQLSYKFVSIDDEMSAVAETTLVETPEDFEYFKYPSHIRFVNNMTDKTPDTHTNALAVDAEGEALDQNGDKCSDSGLSQATRGDFRWSEAPAAVYTPATDENQGSVCWPLETTEVKNETYEVTFTVYPNQHGWDMITVLANHWNDPDFDWSSVSAEKVTNADGSVDIYEIVYDPAADTWSRSGRKLLSTDASGNVQVSSNDEATLTYKTVERVIKEVDGVPTEVVEEEGPFTAEYTNPYMSVEPSTYKIRKIWKDTLIPRWPVEEVDLEIWYVSKGNVKVAGTEYWKDSDTGDYTDKSEIAYVDDDGTIWYWSAKAEDMPLSEADHLSGYINIHEPNEELDDSNLGYGATKVTVGSFNYMKSNGMIDSENYRINASGERLRNANGNLIQYFAYWETETNIAPGLIATSISQDPLPGAKGHYYALREEDSSTNLTEQFQQHFELHSDVTRPMKRDGIMDTNSDTLSGTNSRKGELAVTKMVLTQDRHEIHPDVPFQVSISLTDSDGNTLMQEELTGFDDDGQPVFTRQPRTDIEYVIYDAEGNVVGNPTGVVSSQQGTGYTVGVSRTAIDSGASTSLYHVPVNYDAASGRHTVVYPTLYAGWTIVLVNLPSGTRWEVQETYNSAGRTSDGYQFEGYTLPDERRGSETLHPQPHYISDMHHYSGGTVRYDAAGTVIETDLVRITDFEHADAIRDVNGRLIADGNGAAAYSISGYIDIDAEELVDIHNIRTADDLEIRKTDADDSSKTLSGAKFVIESQRPVTEWVLHEENGTKEWREIYVFDSEREGYNEEEPDSPNMMPDTVGPAHYPASVHIHGDRRYVVRGDVIGVLYALPRSEWADEYTPRPLDLDGNEITSVQWVRVPGNDVTGLTSGVHYINQNGVNYILRPSTSVSGKYEKVPDTRLVGSHVYYYVESDANGLLKDPDPNHQEKLKELPIIAGDETTYSMYEIEAPEGYLTLLEQLQAADPGRTWADAAIEITITSNRVNGVPYLEWTDPRTGGKNQVSGVWDSASRHWDFNFSITDKKGYNELELQKIQSGSGNSIGNVRFSLFREVPAGTDGAAFIYYNTNESVKNYKNVLNPVRDVVSVSEYAKLKGKASESGNYIDEDGYLVDSSGARVQHNGRDVLYQPNRYVNGSERGIMYLLPAENRDGTVLLGLSTDSSGRIDFGALAQGTYWLFEQTPDGYIEALPTKITVASTRVTYKNDALNGGAETEADSSSNEDGTVVYEMTLENTPKDLTLPNTGGSGIHWLIITGLLLLIGSASGLTVMSKKKSRL